MTRSVRLFWRTARFEIVVGVAISLGMTVAMLLTAGRLDEIRAAACPGLRSCDDAAFTSILLTFSEPLRFGASLMPLAIGLLFGPALVARELERGSAPFAWALVHSRVRWLVWRSWPAALLVVLLLTELALAGERLEVASLPQFDTGQSFYDVGSRGALLVLRGLAALAIGLAAGVVLGRTLTATLLAGACCIVAIGLAAYVRPLWLPREVVSLQEMNQETAAVPLTQGGGVVMPDGRLLTDKESAALRPPDAGDINSPAYAIWLMNSGAHRVYVGLPGARYPEIVLREGLATGLVAGLGMLVALLAVRNRRLQPGFGVERNARRDVAPFASPRPPDHAAWRRSPGWLSWLMTTRVSRPEVLAASIVAAAIPLVTLLVIQLLGDARVAQGCVDTDCLGEGPFSQINNPLENWLYPLLATLPFFVGGVLGGPVIAREFETGAGQLTWSLTGNRLFWLAWRIVPLIVLTTLLLIPAAVLGNALIHAQRLVDPTFDFGAGQIRGAPLVARGLALFGVGLLAGVLWRRILPALVVTAIVGVLLYNGLDWIDRGDHLGGDWYWLPPVVLGLPGDPTVGLDPPADVLGDDLQAPDGSFHLPYEVALANGFPRLTPTGDLIEMDEGFIDWYTAHGYRYVSIGWPRSLYPEFVVRESASLLVGALVLVLAAGVILERRRLG